MRISNLKSKLNFARALRLHTHVNCEFRKMDVVCQFQVILGQGFQVCHQNCKFSRVHVASALKNQRDLKMHVVCLFYVRVASVARALKSKECICEKCILYVYSKVFWVKDFKSVVKIAIFKIKKLSGKKLDCNFITVYSLM